MPNAFPLPMKMYPAGTPRLAFPHQVAVLSKFAQGRGVAQISHARKFTFKAVLCSNVHAMHCHGAPVAEAPPPRP